MKKMKNALLPSPSWLTVNGFSALQYHIYSSPDEFAHIEQERAKPYKKIRNRTSLKESVIAAEKLARANKGVLPTQTWLMNNGYSHIVRRLYSHQEAFAHIQQERGRKSLADHLVTAQKLVRKNNGLLPNGTWLKENGYRDLASYFEKSPEAFGDIKQEKKYNSLEENIVLAVKLAKHNKGTLPSPAWLRANGYRHLVSAIQQHRRLFSHIKQAKCYKTPQEHLATARQLCKKHGGVLPSRSWLESHGYSDLISAIKKHSKTFSKFRKCSA